ncbi:MAG: glycosyltransferase family 9 protein [Nostocaceae cyanobacterium]|nr:glycosyltransferase family 9 protein [Nostocaceae cyanobacterium]
MRILALVPGGIGDQILFFPTLDDLKRNYPQATIDVLVEPRAKSAYRVCKSVHEVLTFDYKDRNSLADFGNLVGILRDREYNTAISVTQNANINFLLWLTGIPTRVGYQGKGSFFLTNSVPLKTEQYTAAMYHDLLQGIGIKSPTPDLTINVPKPDIDWAQNEQKRLNVHETGYILIYGGTNTTSNGSEYPQSSWQQIVQDFRQKQPEMPVVVVQEPEDNFGQVRSLGASEVKITSPSDIGKLAAMIAGANLMLCIDSPPMHLAVAVQTYTIALFGLSSPQQLLPTSDRFLAIKSPNGNLASISPATILEKVWGA